MAQKTMLRLPKKQPFFGKWLVRYVDVQYHLADTYKDEIAESLGVSEDKLLLWMDGEEDAPTGFDRERLKIEIKDKSAFCVVCRKQSFTVVCDCNVKEGDAPLMEMLTEEGVGQGSLPFESSDSLGAVLGLIVEEMKTLSKAVEFNNTRLDILINRLVDKQVEKQSIAV